MAAGSALPFLCAWLGANGFAQLLDRAGLTVRDVLREAQIEQAKAQIAGVDKTKPKPEDIEAAAMRAKSLGDEAQAALRARDQVDDLRGVRGDDAGAREAGDGA